MKRRSFIKLASAGVGTVALSRCARQCATAPQRVISQDGLLEVDLTAMPSVHRLGHRRAQLMTYNAQLPGPVLELQPGDTVRIHFTNRLAQPTNLHFHGLHIPPTGTGDNPFLEIPPGEAWTYEFQLPANHPAGLGWYHPHYHGRVAEQVFAGLAGPLILRGDFDAIPEIQAAPEQLLVLKDFGLTRNGQVADPSPLFRRWGREGDLLTVNGQLRPDYRLTAGQLHRLRLLNASTSKIFRLTLSEHSLYLAATDGRSLAAPVAVSEVVLAPGERAEVLVLGDRAPGSYALLSQPYDRGIAKMLSEPLETAVLATFTYADTYTDTYTGADTDAAQPARSSALPKRLLPVESLPDPVATREFILDHGIDHSSGAQFIINGKAYDHSRVDTQVKLGTVEDWVIVNRASMDHPFHLHTNHFQVLARNGEPAAVRAWKDTLNLRAYETAKLRVRFADYPGETVYHCHILDHEDQGMMGVIEMQA
ncbi:MAG: multicopper oxidase family protein [Leptolyngbya sp. SIO4C1]|nr:multicopper oxidase family protein [Leptolyngbya sp. SIO4C1]